MDPHTPAHSPLRSDVVIPTRPLLELLSARYYSCHDCTHDLLDISKKAVSFIQHHIRNESIGQDESLGRELFLHQMLGHLNYNNELERTDYEILVDVYVKLFVYLTNFIKTFQLENFEHVTLLGHDIVVSGQHTL